MAAPEATQRAYTLRLSGIAQADLAWRDALWKTHEAVNRGAKVFGDWLLTLRGGLSSELADDVKTADERRNRRVVLGLSWLSVESRDGAPLEYLVAGRDEPGPERAEKVLAEFRQILERRGLTSDEVDSWITDCRASLSARIRDDAVWVNRSSAFDDTVHKLGGDLRREEVWDLFDRFFGGREAYFAGISSKSADEDESAKAASEEKAKDLCQKARGWLSNRFGSGTGSDFSAVGEQYRAFAQWCQWKADVGPVTPSESRKRLCESLSLDPLPARLAGTPGPPNRAQLAYQDIRAAMSDGDSLPDLDYRVLAEVATKLAEQKLGRTGRKARRAWADQILADVERACGITFRDTDAEADRINEFSVILDHAARRVSMNHSWQKRAENRRRMFEDDARKIASLSGETCALLAAFTAKRSGDTEAIEPYRIRRRAIDGWRDITTEWSRPGCKTPDDRIAAARRLESELQGTDAKFGDIQLFEELAEEKYRCVWESPDGLNAQALIDYVAANEADWNQRRFKVPAYRHPDALRHPVFCDFGESRWSINFAAHRAPAASAVAGAALERKAAEMRKAEAALGKAKTEAQRAKAMARCASAKVALGEAESQVAWLSRRRGLRMRLFDGSAARDFELLWQSKRFTADAALRQQDASEAVTSVGVSRADRLGRAAADADPNVRVNVLGLLDLKEWNGRLQVPRRELEKIARIQSDEALDGETRQDRVAKLCRRLNWFVTFSARLQPFGPWLNFVDSLPPGHRYDPKTKRLYCEANKGRKGRALLALSRLPNLRLLSVDLGHRYAAACAVWQVVSKQDVDAACTRAGQAPPSATQLYLLLQTETGKLYESGKRKGTPIFSTAVFRRVGVDAIQSRPSVASWARLDRQFLIKLNGEERPARKASPSEICDVDQFETSVGFSRRSKRRCAEMRVDELMRDALRTARLALKRHGRRARIAYRLTATTIPTVGGETRSLDHNGLIDSLAEALADWYDLAFGKSWTDDGARQLWDQYVHPMLAELEPLAPPDDDLSPAARRKQREDTEKKLRPAAEALGAQDRTQMHIAWASRWCADDEKWPSYLKQLTNWLLPHGLKWMEPYSPNQWERLSELAKKDIARQWKVAVCSSDSATLVMINSTIGKHNDRLRQMRGSAMHVGGLSLMRIATIRELYKVRKAHRYRPVPDDLRSGIRLMESDAANGYRFSDRVLRSMERMREQRVKQLASRIVEAALGVGKEQKRIWDQVKRKWRDPERPRDLLYQNREGVECGERRFEQCHVIVIENLRNYRPDELRTRRENKALMDWSSGKVRKYLEDACQLHGLHLREVNPRWTSLQCSRTGLPGVRCVDVPVDPVKGEPKVYWWRKALAAAQRKTSDEESRFIVDLANHLSDLKVKGAAFPASIRLPRRGGDLVVAAPPRSCMARGHERCALCRGKRAIQADVNAAANIGLKALLDPDWPGAWWNVPCDPKTYEPSPSTSGSAVFDGVGALATPPKEEKPGRGRRRGRTRSSDPDRAVYLWRDISTRPIVDGRWCGYQEYQNRVQYRVIQVLREQAGLEGAIPVDHSEEVPF